ncbi:MAG: SurA N-terminal domain [Gaiellaceae bacterium]|jgi:hypothetical protein|nr:SurA N-terminal domain [Gaiellaceae bacterium]
MTALCLALLAGCGGGSNTTVAHVGGDAITTKQLDGLVSHFRTEAQREGKDFPKDGTQAFRQLRNQLLSLLVYRVELRQAAVRLGVKADPNEITRRLGATGSGEQEGDPAADTFARDSVEAQLLTEGIFAKVTRGVKSSAARNRKMAAFVARLQRQTTVRYEPGYKPGS